MKIALAVACCVVVLAACSADDPAPSTTAAAQPASTTEAEPEIVAITAAPCSLADAAGVADATGLAIEPGRDDGPITCRFDLTETPGVHVAVIIEDGERRLGGAAAIFDGYLALVPEGGAEEIPGLGAAALYAPGFRGLAVDADGGRFFAVAIGGGYQALAEPREALIAVARDVLSGL